MIEKKSLARILQRLAYLPDRTPEMAFEGGAEPASTEVARYRNGAIFVGYYSGNTEWERHPGGDEIVACIEGRTTVVLLMNGPCNRIDLNFGELLVVPRGCWHRFEKSVQLKVLSVTPEPTDHTAWICRGKQWWDGACSGFAIAGSVNQFVQAKAREAARRMTQT